MKYLIFVSTLLLLFCGCNSTDPEFNDEFSIYLAEDVENNSAVNSSLEKLILEEEPIITSSSVVTYQWSNHIITFSNEAKEKIKVKEPLFGRFFVVTVSNKRVYWGMFTDGAYSGSCNNPVISVWSRIVHQDTSYITNKFRIDRAYPVYAGDKNNKDIRNDMRIYQALVNSGKLIE